VFYFVILFLLFQIKKAVCTPYNCDKINIVNDFIINFLLVRSMKLRWAGCLLCIVEAVSKFHSLLLKENDFKCCELEWHEILANFKLKSCISLRPHFSELKVRFLRFSRKEQDGSAPSFFFQYLGENTCSLQPALKSSVPGL